MKVSRVIHNKKDREIFYCSVFFVLGFAVIFSFLGIILQTVLTNASVQVQGYLNKIAGVFIILFGASLVGLLPLNFLQKDHKIRVGKKFNSRYAMSFIVGAAFAIGWTPCVGPILGAVLTLAATKPTTAFFLLLAYTAGLGIPLLIVGAFMNKSKKFIKKLGKSIVYINHTFGFLLIFLGMLIFANQLGILQGNEAIANMMASVNLGTGTEPISITIAFIAGLVSFLSPCILPLIPGYLTYLGTVALKKK